MFWALRSGPFPWTPLLFWLCLVSKQGLRTPTGLTSCKCKRARVFSRMTPAPSFLTGMNTENTESQRMTKIMAEIQALQEVVTRFRQMRLDATEFACLKCIVTFKAGECHHFRGSFLTFLVEPMKVFRSLELKCIFLLECTLSN